MSALSTPLNPFLACQKAKTALQPAIAELDLAIAVADATVHAQPLVKGETEQEKRGIVMYEIIYSPPLKFIFIGE